MQRARGRCRYRIIRQTKILVQSVMLRKALTEAGWQAGDAMICMRCDTLADPEKSVTGKPMNCWSLETRVSGLWSGVCIRAGYYSLPAYAGVTIRGIEDK